MAVFGCASWGTLLEIMWVVYMGDVVGCFVCVACVFLGI